MDIERGIIYSKGQDKKSTYGYLKNSDNKLTDVDNIVVSYIGPLTLTGAKIKINPRRGDPKSAEAKEISKTFDVLHLYFNKPVVPKTAINLQSSTDVSAGTVSNADPGADKIFRYYEYNPKNQMRTAGATFPDSDLAVPLPSDPIMVPTKGGRFNDFYYANEIDPAPGSTAGYWGYGADSKEIVIRLPNGCTNVLVPGKHFINLTGAKNNPNKCFFEAAGVGTPKGAQASGCPIMIGNFD